MALNGLQIYDKGMEGKMPQAMPMDDMMTDAPTTESHVPSDMPQVTQTIELLKEAIELHEGHMNGSIEASEMSQQQLMDLLTDAISILSGEEMIEENVMEEEDGPTTTTDVA